MKTKVLIIASGILFVIVVLLLQSHKNETTSISAIPTPTSVSVNMQPHQSQTLQPGVSTQQDVKNIYGNPTKTEVKNGNIIDYYAIQNTWRQNKVYLNKDTVQYIVQEQITDNSLYKDFITNYNKQPDGILYNPEEAGAETKWYVFSTSGIAFLADTNSGYTFRVLRFPSMLYSDFLTNVAPTFSMQQIIINTRDNNPQHQ